MISFDTFANLPDGTYLELKGKSTDAKPIKIFEYYGTELEIANGSTFLEMDTGNIYFYDKEDFAWLLFGGE